MAVEHTCPSVNLIVVKQKDGSEIKWCPLCRRTV
jgi:hypothetical protein